MLPRELHLSSRNFAIEHTAGAQIARCRIAVAFAGVAVADAVDAIRAAADEGCIRWAPKAGTRLPLCADGDAIPVQRRQLARLHAIAAADGATSMRVSE